MIKFLKNLIYSAVILTLLAGVASAVQITAVYRMSSTGYTSPFSLAKTYSGSSTTEVREYIHIALYDSASGFTHLDSMSSWWSRVDNVQYGVKVNGQWLSGSMDLDYWDTNAICFLVPEGIVAGENVKIEVLDNYAVATYEVDFLPPEQVTDIDIVEDVAGHIDITFDLNTAPGGFNGATSSNSGILIVRTTDEALSTLPVDGTTYSVGGTIGSGRGQGTVIYNGKVFTASSSLPERDHVYYYYFFPHDGTPNYNVQEARGELDLRYPTVSVSGIWLTTASSAGSPFGSRLTRAEPGTWITITGEGFTNLGGTVNFVSGETIAYSYASGDSVIGSGWWEDVDGTGHVNFMIPTDVAYGTYDIQVVNYYSKVGTVEDFAIIPDDSITGRPLLTTIYANTGPSTWQVTTEAHVCDLIKITGTNIGSGATVRFGTTAATVLGSSSTEVQVYVPTVEVGSKTITVTNYYGSGTKRITILPPRPLYSFMASSDYGQVTLSWSSPATTVEDPSESDNAGFAGMVIIRSNSTKPYLTSYTGRALPSGYTKIYDYTTDSSSGVYADSSVTAGTTYRYNAFAFDGINYSSASTDDATALNDQPIITDVVTIVRSVVEVSTTESKVGGYIEIKGSTFEDATEGITFTSLTIGGVSIPVTATSSNGYTVYSSSKIGVWLPQGVKTGDIVVTTSRGTDNWGRTFTILPPGQVSWVGATPGDEEIGLRWVNPTQDEAGTLDSALYGTMLLRSQTSMALNSFIPINEYTGYTVDTETNPGSGIYVVYDGTAVSSLTDDGLTNGVTYYYRAITHDLAGHYNSTTANATACATPVDTSTVSAPQIDDVYGWLTGSVTTREVRVGAKIAISGSYLGTGTAEVTVNGVAATYVETQSEYYLKVIVPETVAGTATVKVRNTTTGLYDEATITILPPAAVNYFGLAATGSGWISYSLSDNCGYTESSYIESTIVAYSTAGYPATPTGSGVVVVYDSAPESSSHTETVSDLTNGQTYYFSAFAYDGVNYSSALTLMATPSATGSTVSAPQIDSAYGWLSDGSTTTQVRVGAKVAISGRYLGAGTAEVTVNGVVATYTEDQSEYYLKVIVPETVAGTATVKVRNITTGLYDEATITILPPAAVNYFGLVSTGSGWISYSLSDNCGWSESSYVESTIVACSTTEYPASPTGTGVLVIYNSSPESDTHTEVATGLTNGQSYYFSAFACDGVNYSSALTLMATPSASGSDTPPVTVPEISAIYLIIDTAGTLDTTPTLEAAPGTWIAIIGQNLGASGEVVFNGASGNITLYHTDTDNVGWWATGARINVKVPSTAISGYITVERGEDEQSATTDFIFTITGTSTTLPAIATLSPDSGAVGSTVTISGSNFGEEQGTSRVIFENTPLTYAATVSAWSSGSISILVPEVALGAYNVYVEAGETESNTKTFTVVEQGSSSSDMVIDDFEGTKVSPTSYYLFDDDSSKPLYEVQTTEIAEGSQALKVQYTYLNLGEDDWGGGIGASLAQSLDISSASAVTLMIKGDGSQNSVRLDLIDEDGESWSSEQISLSRTGWYQVTLDLDDFTFNTFGTTGNGVFNKTITGYQLVYTTKYSSTSYHYVDYIVAVAESDDTNRPVIVSVDPSEATVGSTVTIVGSNFGATQSESEVRLGGVSVGSVISSWSDSQIVFVLPDTFETGEYDLQVYRKDATQGIDALSEAKPFRVIAASTKAKVYPNPFNPLSETIKIQVSATEAMEVSLFIYDITARVIYKTSASLSVGTNEITWDGKNYLNAIVGDGVYLVRVVNNANKELISKAKILVIKRN